MTLVGCRSDMNDIKVILRHFFVVMAPPKVTEMRRQLRLRCYGALDCSNQSEMESILRNAGKSKCILAERRRLKKGGQRRVHMRGASSRMTRVFTHVYLYWVSKLGVDYPIGERLLRKDIWKKLLNVRCLHGGIQGTRGHFKPGGVIVAASSTPPPSGGVVVGDTKNALACINPRHYTFSRDTVASEEIFEWVKEDVMEMASTESEKTQVNTATTVSELCAICTELYRAGGGT